MDLCAQGWNDVRPNLIGCGGTEGPRAAHSLRRKNPVRLPEGLTADLDSFSRRRMGTFDFELTLNPYLPLNSTC